MQPLKGFTMLELVVSIGIISVLGALCVPGFSRLQGRAKQAEAKTNLRALNDFELAYYMSFDTFSTSVGRIGFTPTRGNRYQYNLVGTSSLNADARSGATANTPAGADAIMIDTFKYPSAYKEVRIAALKCGSVAAVTPGIFGRFLGTAQGNIDNDPTADQWSVASYGRDLNACADVAGNAPAGEPENEQDDTVQGNPDDRDNERSVASR